MKEPINLLTMEHIRKGFTDRTLFDDVSLGINENDRIGVIGINGTGKSTLLKMIAGLRYNHKREIIKNRLSAAVSCI